MTVQWAKIVRFEHAQNSDLLAERPVQKAESQHLLSLSDPVRQKNGASFVHGIFLSAILRLYCPSSLLRSMPTFHE